jgi:hypothetical protein
MATDEEYLDSVSNGTCKHCGHRVQLETLLVDLDGVYRADERDA